MPFVFDEENVEWPENAPDDYELPPPKPEDFEYLAPPDFGGAKEPVRFSVTPPDAGASGADASAQRPKRPLKLRLMNWLLDKLVGGATEFTAQLHRQQRQAEQQRARLFAVMVPALKTIGGRKVHCVYDGGNDEGFAWFGSLETADGSLTLNDVVDRLADHGLQNQLLNAEIIHEHSQTPRSERDHLVDIVSCSLPEEWACLLLGWGFGTGAFTMYGAFTVDLNECVITDDRDADVPADGNIVVATGDD